MLEVPSAQHLLVANKVARSKLTLIARWATLWHSTVRILRLANMSHIKDPLSGKRTKKC